MAPDKRNRERGVKGDEALMKERMRKGGGLTIKGRGWAYRLSPLCSKGGRNACVKEEGGGRVD